MRIGRKTDLLSPAEREIVERFERGAIDAAEAGRLLIASVERADVGPAEALPPTPVEPGATAAPADEAASEAEAEAEAEPEFVVDPNETPEEAAARQLVERIAREVDEELKR